MGEGEGKGEKGKGEWDKGENDVTQYAPPCRKFLATQLFLTTNMEMKTGIGY